MVSKEELKQIAILSYLTDEMLDKMLPIIDVLRFDEQEIIFREGDFADRFFMVKRGKVLLELRVSDKATVSVGSVKPGFSFGWSAMLDSGAYTTDAVCAEATELYSARREKILNLFNNDHSMGYVMTQRLIRIMKKRLDIRTEQFIRLIKNHPDMQHLF
jgi:CRP-like cAMP-binding protein